MFCTHLPELQAIACCVLKQPVCASACEQKWSNYGQLKTHGRNRMGHYLSVRRVYVHEVLHFQLKPNASCRMPSAAWSDSDSDAASDADDDEKAVSSLIA